MFRGIGVLLGMALGATWSGIPLAAHDLTDEQQVRLVLLTWANSRSGADAERGAAVLHERLKGTWPGGDKAAYVAAIPGRTFPRERIFLRHAKLDFDRRRTRVRVAPVVMVSDWYKGTLSLELQREADRWLIVSIEPGPELPPEFRDPGVGRPLHEVGVKVRDASLAEPVVARAYGSALLPYQVFFTKGIPPFAHTSPVYLEVEGRPTRSPEDAVFFRAWCDRAIDWVKTKGRYDPAQKAEVLALFERARQEFLDR